MKKKILLIAIITFTVLLFSGCGNVSEKDKATCEKNAIRTAKKYIKKKYGFEPTIITSEAIIEELYFDASKYGEELKGATVYAYDPIDIKEFTVTNSCKRFKDDSTDDYQAEEIKEYMTKYFEKGAKNILKNEKAVISYEVNIDDNSEANWYSFREYFDKNNLNDKFLYLLNNVKIVSLGESGISNSAREKLLKLGYGNIYIYNVRDLNEYNKYLKEKTDKDYNIPYYLLYSYEINNNWNKQGKWSKEEYNTIIDNGIHFISTDKGKFIEQVNSNTYEPENKTDVFSSPYFSKISYKILTEKGIDIYIPSETVSKYNLSNLKIGHLDYRTYSDGSVHYYQDWNNWDLNKDKKSYIYYPNQNFGENDIIQIFK